MNTLTPSEISTVSIYDWDQISGVWQQIPELKNAPSPLDQLPFPVTETIKYTVDHQQGKVILLDKFRSPIMENCLERLILSCLSADQEGVLQDLAILPLISSHISNTSTKQRRFPVNIISRSLRELAGKDKWDNLPPVKKLRERHMYQLPVSPSISTSPTPQQADQPPVSRSTIHPNMPGTSTLPTPVGPSPPPSAYRPTKRSKTASSENSSQKSRKQGATIPDIVIHFQIDDKFYVLMVFEIKRVIPSQEMVTKPFIFRQMATRLRKDMMDVAMREAIYQEVWYLHMSGGLFGTSFGVALINEYFYRLFRCPDGTILIETATQDDTVDIVTIDDLDSPSCALWIEPPHAILKPCAKTLGLEVDEDGLAHFSAFVYSAIHRMTDLVEFQHTPASLNSDFSSFVRVRLGSAMDEATSDFAAQCLERRDLWKGRRKGNDIGGKSGQVKKGRDDEDRGSGAGGEGGPSGDKHQDRDEGNRDEGGEEDEDQSGGSSTAPRGGMGGASYTFQSADSAVPTHNDSVTLAEESNIEARELLGLCGGLKIALVSTKTINLAMRTLSTVDNALHDELIAQIPTELRACFQRLPSQPSSATASSHTIVTPDDSPVRKKMGDRGSKEERPGVFGSKPLGTDRIKSTQVQAEEWMEMSLDNYE